MAPSDICVASVALVADGSLGLHHGATVSEQIKKREWSVTAY